jgi:hypothetical protein
MAELSGNDPQSELKEPLNLPGPPIDDRGEFQKQPSRAKFTHGQKMRQKVSDGFRSQAEAERNCMVSRNFLTVPKQVLNLIEAIKVALTGNSVQFATRMVTKRSRSWVVANIRRANSQ